MREVIEGNKRYVLDDNGLVVEASVIEPKVEEPQTPFAIGDRVEAEGKAGKIIGRFASVYGPTVAVAFDDGEVEEYLAEQVVRTEVEATAYDNPFDELRANWTEYQKLPAYTLEELDTKAALARQINVVSKALLKSSTTHYQDKLELDQIVLNTTADLLDFKEHAARLELESEADYLNSLPKYNVPDEFYIGASMSREDISWLLVAADEATEDANTLDWDSLLTNEALLSTAKLTEEQLSSDNFMDSVADYREEAMPLGFDEEKKSAFRAKLEQARQNALVERKAKATAHTAKVEEDLSDFNDAQLFL